MGRKLSIESKIKRRINRIKDLKIFNSHFHPSYNKEACGYFQLLNMFNGWNGKHALNGGEYHIDGLDYWVDYYEPNLNLVLEWDEKYHYKGGKLRERDLIRQEQIKKHLGCNFYRIKKLTNGIIVVT